MNVQEFAELSAGHALGALSPEDERAYLEALEAHPEWTAIADADEQTAASLAETVTEVSPPVAARSMLLRAVQQPSVDDDATDAAEDAAETTDDETTDDTVRIERPSTEAIQTIERRTWMRAMFGLVASMVLLVGIGWVAGSVTEQLRTPASVVALQEIEAAPDSRSLGVELDDGGAATAHWSESLGKAVLVSRDLPEIDADQTYEMWFVRGEDAISAGTFVSDGGSTTVALEGEMYSGDTIAVTVEPAGGAPEGTPTSDPIVVIPTA